MNGLRTSWIVARWEFTTTVLRPSFLAMLIGLPAVHLAIAALLGISLGLASAPPKAWVPVAVVDEYGVLADLPAHRDTIVRNKADALGQLVAGRLDGVYVLHADYLQTGGADVFERPAADMLQVGKAITNRERAAATIRRGLSGQVGLGSREERLVDPIVSTKVFRVEGDRVSRRIAPPIVDVFAGPFGVCFIMGLSIFLASGGLQQAMANELRNRMLEVMLSIVTPLQLLTGKVLGLAAAGLLQAIVYLAITAGVAPLLGGLAIDWGVLAWCSVIFLTGYILFAVLMAGTGALSRDAQEVPQLASLWMLLAAVPFFFILHIGADATSWLSRTLTWFPPTAPVALLLRLASGGVSVAERLAVVVFVLLFALIALRLSAWLFGARVQGVRLWR